MNKKDFDMLKNNNSFLDNGATTLTPNSVIESMNEYYRSYTSNIHRGDYDAAIKTNEVYDSTRDVIKKFVGAKDSDKVIYTSGTTMSLNLVIYGLNIPNVIYPILNFVSISIDIFVKVDILNILVCHNENSDV